ncbi:integrator complex subunit 1-like [Haliotis rufescens]|uniref:integrator complex subunit 1-like n=1 Tax=Haliotis rufescens TaxID=6454 RepID=UPI00201EB845|nr:integrator complex subunit 1-like [Haliotis rufescens]
MERSKAAPGKKGPKPKGHPPTGDFIALGVSKGKGAEPDTKRSTSPQPVGRKATSSADRKREAPVATPTTGGLAPKKPKLGQTFMPLGRHGDVERKGSPATVVPLQFEETAIDVDPCEVLDQLLVAEESGSDERIEGLLCGAVKSLRSNRAKPDPAVFLSLMYLAKTRPTIFCSEVVIEAFCSLLKRDMSLNFKAKGNPLVSVAACNVLYAAFIEEENWPDDFVKVYVEDSLGERVWVDRDDCKGFVDNILTAFRTKMPPKSMLVAADPPKGESPGSASPVLHLFEEDEGSKGSDGGDSEKSSVSGTDSDSANVFQRFPYQQDSIESYIMELIREQLIRRQPMDASARNLIRLMTVTCGYGEVRALTAQRLEMWLQNPKLARTAQDLLMSVCMNCNQADHSDLDVIAQLIKMRMKTKPLINHYANCMRELMIQHSGNLRIVLTHTIYNELSQTRNPNNMSLVAVTFQISPEPAAKMLAEIFQDLLANKDDYLRALRALLREIVRTLRHDMNFTAFCLGLMQERSEAKFTDLEAAFKERFVMSIADLITLSVLMGITPAVREAVASLARGEHKDLETLQQFKQQVAMIQRDAIWWLHTVVPKAMDVKAAEYVHCLHKVLFMEEAQHYYNKDNWPPEGDRTMMLRLAAEVPVMEDSLMRVLLIGLSRELPLSAADAVELADQLIRRAAPLYLGAGMQVLQVERLELIDALLNLCAYRHPENIGLPKGYQPPTLAISALYWKAWTMLAVISAFNPGTFGLSAWENYPTLKCLMEMAMTNNFKFPPPTTATDDKVIEEIKNRERQIAQQEVQQILEFESHLAAATSKVTITEANSLLLDQLTTMDPNGIARCPPAKVLDQLSNLCNTLKVGQMLCRSRSPDFLLDIIQRQGTSQSMPWLAELVESSEGSLDVLPIQCLCEFLLHEPPESSDTGDSDVIKAEKYRRKEKLKKQRQLLSRLQEMVHGTSSDSSTMFQVLDYFLKRLSSTQSVSRSQAIKGLSMVVSKSASSQEDKDETKMDVDGDNRANDWLLKDLPSLPLFQEVKGQTSLALRQACQIETDPSLVSSYIIFLSQHSLDQNLYDLDNLASDVAQLIVERTSVINHILPCEGNPWTPSQDVTLNALISLYVNYLKKAREPHKEAYTWSNTQDQILLQWESGESATMFILVVHSMITLLTYGPPTGESQYHVLLETWFPKEGHLPSAFLLDTSEEALLLPDWLKLRMIRSSVDQLVNSALQELEPAQLLLFVQSFGIPVASMSKLLTCLDNAVGLDPTGLEQAVLDKVYMAQLIEIQHKRGAKGGEKFNLMLTQHLPRPKPAPSTEGMDTGLTGYPCWQVRKMEEVTLPWGKPNLVPCLLEIFDPSGTSNPRSNKLYQTLIKSISSEQSKAAEVITTMQKILESTKGAEFAARLYETSSRSGPLLKLLISKQTSLTVAVRRMVERLAVFTPGRRSPLLSVIKQFLEAGKASGSESKTKERTQMKLETFKTGGKLDPNKLTQGLPALSGDPDLENLVQQCMTEVMEQLTSADGARVASQALLHLEKVSPMLVSTASLLIDWLELLDPEIIQSNPDLQQQLIFAKKTVSQPRERVPGSRKEPYLLALLTHQCNWGTVNRCITRILNNTEKSFNATSVLDFLWACIHIPKIWQGRECKKMDSCEDILNPTISQVICVVDYILEEADDSRNTTAGESSHPAGAPSPSSSTLETLCQRMSLLKACMADKDVRLRAVVDHLQGKQGRSCLQTKLLYELYLQYPYILSWLTDKSCIAAEHDTHDSPSQLDVISHRLLMALGHAVHGHTAENRMYDANLGCRKLAAEHPQLILRQLPMLAALLRGKTQYKIGEMKHRNFLTLFSNALGLLELLQPLVFRAEYTSLPDILETYFTLIQSHGKEQRLLGSIIVKFITFLNGFVSYDPQRAMSLLQRYVILLGDVSCVYPDLSELKSLLAGLALPRQNKTEADATSQDDTTPIGSPIRAACFWSSAHLAPIHKKLQRRRSVEELLDVLHDLDETSKRKVEILQNFESELRQLMLESNDKCRNLAFALVMRHLRTAPSRSSEFVAMYLQCLSDSNPDIIKTALTNMTEFTVLCQGHAQVILQKVFTIGVTTSMETSSYISETLQLLNLENAQT